MALAEQEFAWNSVANNGSLNFLVQQVGLRLYFYDMSYDPLSTGIKTFSVDVSDFTAPDAVDPGSYPVSMSSGKGYLFVVGAKIEPFYVTYDEETDAITATQIYIKIRDFKGLDDGLANDEEPETLTPEHHYNLRNQGWLNPSNDGSGKSVSFFTRSGELSSYNAPDDELIDQYFTEFDRYPANTMQWWLAKKQNPAASVYSEFSAEILGRLSFGNTPSPRGHYIVNAFYIDRSAMSGVEDLDVETESERPPTCAFSNGRVWYALNNTVYFSQTLDAIGKAGNCHQEADPTAEDISDLIDTDGGVIPIPDMGRAVRLFSAGSGMMIFANNGIWFVSGGQGGFSATDFSITKISPIGTESPNSVVEADGQIFWWSKIGIQGMTQKTGIFGPVEGNFDKVNLSEQTIQGYFNDTIPASAKIYVKSVFDPATNVVQWIWSSDAATGIYRYDRVLNFDLTLQAFYPWSVSSDTGRPWLSGIFVTPQTNSATSDESVTVGGEIVVDSLGDTVTTSVTSLSIRRSFIKYICAVPISGVDQYTFALFQNDQFADWEAFDNPGYRYLSFVETGYELLEDAMRKKQTTYVVCYFRRTEQNWISTGDDYEWDKPSSCLFRTKWDFSSSAISGKWSSLIQAYRMNRVPGFDIDDLTFDNGYPVVVTKNKVRGTGRAIQFRFENSEIGKDFDLLGWAVAYSGNTKA